MVAEDLSQEVGAWGGFQGGDGVVARGEESHLVLRGEELGGVWDLIEKFDERGEGVFSAEYCCEVLCGGHTGGQRRGQESGDMHAGWKTVGLTLIGL